MREGAGSVGLARCRIAAALVDAAWMAGGARPRERGRATR